MASTLLGDSRARASVIVRPTEENPFRTRGARIWDRGFVDIREFLRIQIDTDVIFDNPTDTDINWRKWSVGQGHETINFGVRRSKEAEIRFGGLAEASFSTPFSSLLMFAISQDVALLCISCHCPA